MPAIYVDEADADQVRSGARRQVMRAVRQQEVRRGDWLQLFARGRKRGHRRLGTAVCRQVQTVRMAAPGAMSIGGRPLDDAGLAELADATGFESVDALTAWCAAQGLPWRGVVISWGDLVETW